MLECFFVKGRQTPPACAGVGSNIRPVALIMSLTMIKKARHEDIPKLVALQAAVAAENSIRGYQADSADDWAGRDLTWTWLAFYGLHAVGFIHGVPRPVDGECVFTPENKVLEILELIVAESSRNHGTGRELLLALKVQAFQGGFTHLRVYSAAKRFDDIVRFYRRCGFTPWYLEMTQALRDD